MQKKIFKTMTGTEKAIVFKKVKVEMEISFPCFFFINVSFNIFFLIEANEIGQSQMECGVLPLGHLCNGSNHPCFGTGSRLFS